VLIVRFMRLFYQWLYHPLAFTYDLVAAVVSFGRWNDWVRNVLPYVEGARVLELGHGPGHLQKTLRDLGLVTVGLDESVQMGRLARARLRRHGYVQPNLTRGLTQALPFTSASFDTILSTFPSEYIFDPRTLSEARRVLHNGGRLVILPMAWPRNRLLGWLFRVTGETPADIEKYTPARISEPLERAGFQAQVQVISIPSATLLLVIAQKQD
jgi:ubiquinone/menaquinone biosynthesis C-methylase UbiE